MAKGSDIFAEGGIVCFCLGHGTHGKLWAVTSVGAQKFYPEHPAFLTDGTGREIDPADSEQLFLPSLLSVIFFGFLFTVSEDLPT